MPDHRGWPSFDNGLPPLICWPRPRSSPEGRPGLRRNHFRGAKLPCLLPEALESCCGKVGYGTPSSKLRIGSQHGGKPPSLPPDWTKQDNGA